jgi:hypothetical protein
VGTACLTINYGTYLTEDVSRKMHGKTVGVLEENPGVYRDDEKQSV